MSSTLLPKTTAEFSKEEYWDQFFTSKGKDGFEWYGEYEDLAQQLHKYITGKDHLLIVGCGNSNLSERLYVNGLKNQINIDISSVVIDRMKTMYPSLIYELEDVTQLSFKNDMFTCVLDKGTFDALTTAVPDESKKSSNKDPEQNSSDLDMSDKMLAEIDRVLKQHGRFICISLLQEHVAIKLFNFFYSHGWMIRVCRCPLAETKNRLKSASNSLGSILPVYMNIFTKISLPPGISPVIEMTLNESDNTALTRLNSIDELLKNIKEQLTFAFIKKNIGTLGFCAKDGLDMKLASVDGQPRFSLHIIDVVELMRNPVNKQFAVFIVPHGRECEYIFGTHEGGIELAKQTGFTRLVIVHLERGQHYESFKSIQEEISSYLHLFAPTMVVNQNIKAPILTIDENLGERKVLMTENSEFSGDMIVEEVTFQGRTHRRLIFLAHPTIIQSEVEMEKEGGARSGDQKRRRRRNKHKTDPNNSAPAPSSSGSATTSSAGSATTSADATKYQVSKKLACLHHGIMCIAFGLQKCFFNIHESLNGLLIGLGGGLLASFLFNFIPHLKLTNVEIDEKIVKIAHEYFGLPEPDDRFHIVIEDGMKFLQSTESKYNVILLDVDNKSLKEGLTAPPPEFLTLETFELIKTKLEPEGIFVINLTCRSVKLKAEYLNTIVKTFPFVYGYRVEEQVNMIIFCCMKEPLQASDDMQKWISLLNQSIRYVNQIQGYKYDTSTVEGRRFEQLVADVSDNFKILKVE